MVSKESIAQIVKDGELCSLIQLVKECCNEDEVLRIYAKKSQIFFPELVDTLKRLISISKDVELNKALVMQMTRSVCIPQE